MIKAPIKLKIQNNIFVQFLTEQTTLNYQTFPINLGEFESFDSFVGSRIVYIKA